jgi:hypothetical protein
VLHVPYKESLHSFDVHFRPLWDWATDLLQDELLIGRFEWDAQWLFKFNGRRFERFVHEPWTADDFWNIQVCIVDTFKA